LKLEESESVKSGQPSTLHQGLQPGPHACDSDPVPVRAHRTTRAGRALLRGDPAGRGPARQGPRGPRRRVRALPRSGESEIRNRRSFNRVLPGPPSRRPSESAAAQALGPGAGPGVWHPGGRPARRRELR
jgi:hypothetical protein